MAFFLAIFILAALLFVMFKAIESMHIHLVQRFVVTDTKSDLNAVSENTETIQEPEIFTEPILKIKDDVIIAQPANQADQPSIDWSVFEAPACLRKKDQSWVLLFNS